MTKEANRQLKICKEISLSLLKKYHGEDDIIQVFRTGKYIGSTGIKAPKIFRSLNESFKTTGKRQKTARMCVVSCDKGQKVSFTIRSKELNQKKPLSKKNSNRKIINSLFAKFLLHEIGEKHPSTFSGAIVISGRTGSAKTEFLRAIIAEYLRKYCKSKNCHLVTGEDPIECFVDKKPLKGIHYTPREFGEKKDSPDLESVLKDAKRQTPSCVLVGEIRSDQDWGAVIDFAGTGHFIITTTHAASLRETFAKLFKAHDVKMPADRRMVSGNVLACVHLKKGKDYVLPTVWLKTSESINELVSQGVSSVMINGKYVLGRRQIVEKMGVSDPKLRKTLASLGSNLDIEELNQ